VVLPVLLVIATVTYHGVELPFLRMRVRYLRPVGSVDEVVGPRHAEHRTGPAPDQLTRSGAP
jgi:hypothetical protein